MPKLTFARYINWHSYFMLPDMQHDHSLERFVDAQINNYATALHEINNGKKKTHWMWYIFPQIRGLGSSETAKYYSIKDLGEAKQYLEHPVLGPRLIEISNVLLQLNTSDAVDIFGYPDNLKLKSSMTLFSSADPARLVFENVIQKFFAGSKDASTLAIIGHQ